MNAAQRLEKELGMEAKALDVTRVVRVYQRNLALAAKIASRTDELWPDLVERLLVQEGIRLRIEPEEWDAAA